MRVLWLMQKEFRELRRDPPSLRSVIIVPVMQLLVLGYAANLDVQDVCVAVRDADRSSASRELVAEVAAQRFFTIVEETQDEARLLQLMDAGRAQLALDIPPGFGKASRAGAQQVQLLIDGSDAASAGLASAYMTGLLASKSVDFAQRRMEGRPSTGPPLPTITPQIRVWYNPDLRSANYFVPAVAAQILLIITQMFTAMSIVRERETGTLEQLSVTPIRPVELILGKMLPFAAIGIFDFTIVLVVATQFFHVPLRGSVPFLYLAAIPFLLCTLGTGLVISTTSKTQQQALLMNFFFTMPAMLLSGFVFPIANMPKVLQLITYAVPLRYFLEIVRGVFLKGVGPEVLWPQCLAMLGIALLLFVAGVRGFKKRVS